MANIGDKLDIYVTSMRREAGRLCSFNAQVSFSEYDKVEEFMTNIDQHPGATKPQLSDLTEGNVFVARYHADNSWYRAQLLQKRNREGSLKVLFIDFGNEEDVSISDVLQVPGEFFMIPALSVPFTLADFAPADNDRWSVSELGQLKDALVNAQLTAEVVLPAMPGRPCIVKASKEQQSIAEGLVAAGVGKITSFPGLPSIPSVAFEKATQHKVYVTYSESPLHFWVQHAAAEDELAVLHGKIEEEVDTIPTHFNITPGMLCLAKYTDSDTSVFYRAIVSDIYPDQTVKVQYIDYGNSDTVDITDLKVPLPEQFAGLPAQAHPCSLRGEEVGRGDFNKIVEAEDICLTALSKTDAGSLVVELNRESALKSRPSVGDTPTKAAGKGAATSSAETTSAMRYTHMQFNVGMQHSSCISNVCARTGNFHCQLLQNGTVLDELMDKVQNCERVQVKRRLAKGEPCLARSNTDGVLYRATVEEEQGSGYVVCMVDFGFTEIVSAEGLYVMKPDFFSLPIQCFKCSLDKAEMVPLPRLVDMLENYNSKVAVVLKVLCKAGDSYLVELFDTVKTKQSLSRFLLKAHAKREDIPISERNVITVVSQASAQPPRPHTQIIKMVSVPAAEVSAGSDETVYVTAVLSDFTFYGQLVKYASDGLESLQTNLQTVYPGGHDVVPNPGVGDLCCTAFSEDEQYYRAEIIGIERGNVTVSFIDFGNQEVKRAGDLYRLAPDFCSLPRQGVVCKVTGHEGCNAGVLENLILEKDVVVRVGKKSAGASSGYCVTFPKCQPNEEILKTLKSTSKPEIPKPKIERGTREKVIVTHIEEKGHIYCQLVRSSSLLGSLMEKVAHHAERSPPVRAQVGDFVVAKYSADQNWYRGRVLGVKTNAVHVQFVDYGNSEAVNVNVVKELPIEVAETPCQALCCSLENARPFTSQDFDKLWAIVEGAELNLEVLDYSPSGDVFTVKMRHGNRAFEEILWPAAAPTNPSANWAQGFEQSAKVPGGSERNSSERNSSPAPVATRYKYQDMPTNKYFDCFVSYIASPSKFWVNLKSSTDALEELMDKINAEYNALPDDVKILTRPAASQACCAKFSADNKWYRAKVLIPEREACVVSFVDYGNDEKVPMKRLKTLNPAYSALPVQAMECCLTEVGPVGDTWTEAATETFEKIASDKKLVAQVVRKHKEGKFEVELVDNTEDLSSALVKAGVAKDFSVPLPSSSSYSSRPESAASTGSRGSGSQTGSHRESRLSYKPQSLQMGKFEDVNVSYVKSPHLFWCQLTQESPRLQDVMQTIEETYGPLSAAELQLTHPEKNQPCCCVFSEDGGWYRGIIADLRADSALVKFVDYGNDEWKAFGQLKQMQKHLMSLPAQAIKCRLDGVEPCSTKWSERDISSFEDMTFDRAMFAKGVAKNRDTYIIELVDGSQDRRPMKNQMIATGIASPAGAADTNVSAPSWMQHEIRNENGAGVQKSPPPRAQIPAEPSGVKLHVREMRVGQTYRMCVSWMEGPNEFYCQSEDSDASLTQLVQDLYDHYIRIKMNAYSVQKPTAGDFVVAYYEADGSWYRAVIREATSTHATVQYVDYGNVDRVPLSKVKQLKSEFARLPMQAVNCCLFGLDGVHSDEITDRMKEAYSKSIGEQLVACRIVAQKKDRYLVDIQDNRGSSLSEKISGMLKSKRPAVAEPRPELRPVVEPVRDLREKLSRQRAQRENTEAVSLPEPQLSRQRAQRDNTEVVNLPEPQLSRQRATNEDPEAVSLPEPQLPRENVDVYVAEVYSLHSFYVQLADNEELLGDFASELNDEYCLKESDAKIVLKNPKVGQTCCAKYSVDEAWYRVRISSIEGATAKVLFIDFGNTDGSPVSDLKVLIPKFQTTPPLAIECRLSGVGRNASAADLEKFKEAIKDEKILKASFISGKEPVEVRLLDGDADLSALFVLPQSPRKMTPQSPKVHSQSPKVQSPKKTRTSPEADALPEMEIPTAPVSVFIALIESPKQFYLHISARSDSLDIFTSMIESGAIDAPALSNPSVGNYCLALFTEDDSWYRGKITSIDGTKATVYFIDYGNSNVIDVSSGNLKVLSSSLRKESPYAIKCELEGLAAGDLPDEATEMLVDMGMDRELTATVIQQTDETCTIKLKDGRFNIGTEIKKFCDSQPKQEFATVADIATTAQNGTADARVLPSLEISSTNYATYISHVESLTEMYLQLSENSGALEDLMAELEQIEQASKAIASPEVGQACAAVFEDDCAWYRGVVTKVSGQKVTVNFVDYGNSQEIDVSVSPIRALPSNLSSRPKYAIKCKAVGAEHFPEGAVEQLMELALDKELNASFVTKSEPCDVVLQSEGENLLQIIKKRFSERDVPPEVLNDSGEPAVGEDSKKDADAQAPVEYSKEPEQVKSTDSVAATEEVNAEPKEKTETSGSQAEQNLEPQEYEVLSLSPGKYQVYVSSIENPDQLYLQFTKDQVAIEEMLDMVEDHCASTGDESAMTNRRLGQPCLAIHTDGSWYRAIITEVDESTTTVTFVDYGNSEKITGENLKRVPEKLLSPPPYAFEVSMTGAVKPDGGWPEDVVEEMLSLLSEKILSAEITNASVTPYNAVIYDRGMNLNKNILGENYKEIIATTEESPTQETGKATELSLPMRSLLPGDVDVYVCSVVSPELFYVQLTDDEEKLTDLTTKLNDDYAADLLKRPALASPPPGSLCCAMWTEDAMWYRAEVKFARDDKMKVFFLDYGNSENVDAGDVKELDREYCSVAPYAIECSINVSDPSEDFSDKFTEKVNDACLKARVMADGPPYMVELYDGDTRLFDDKLESPGSPGVSVTADTQAQEEQPQARGGGEAAVKECTSATTAENQVSLSEVLSVEKRVEVNVCYFISPEEFWCQLVSMENEINRVLEKLSDSFESSQPMSDLKVETGKIYAVRYEEDEVWYRAEALEEINDVWSMHFVDYGNTGSVCLSDVRPLDDVLRSLEPLCFRCRLSGVKGLDNAWSDSAINRFEDLVTSDTITASLEGSVAAEKGATQVFRVQLLHGDQDISQVLLKEGLAVDESSSQRVKVNQSSPELDSSQTQPSQETEEVVASQSAGATGSSSTDVPTETDEGHKIVRFESYTLTCGDIKDVYVPTAESPSLFWCQPAKSSNDELPLLMDQIHHLYSNKEDSPRNLAAGERQVGMACVARFHDDNVWYRAEITAVSGDDKVEVCFVDYGNAQSTPAGEVKVIEAELLQLPKQAICCSLTGLEPTGGEEFDKASCSRFEELATFDGSKQFVIRIDAIGESCTSVSLKDGDRDIAQVLLDGGYAKKIGEASASGQPTETPSNTPIEECVDDVPTTPSMTDAGMEKVRTSIQKVKDIADKEEDTAPESVSERLRIRRQSSGSCYADPDLDVGDVVKVEFNDGDTPEEFILQLVDSKAKLDDLQSDLNEHCNSAEHSEEEVTTVLEVGEKCIAQFPEDDNWYRAIVADYQPGPQLYEVKFVDYGNRALVPPKRVQTLKRELDYLSLPMQAFSCRLANISPSDEKWSAKACQMFTEWCSSNKLLCALIEGKPELDLYDVTLYPADGSKEESINAALLTAELAVDKRGVVPVAVPLAGSDVVGEAKADEE